MHICKEIETVVGACKSASKSAITEQVSSFSATARNDSQSKPSPQKEGFAVCKAPLHFLEAESYNGHNKQIALFLSLKRIFESSVIWNWEKLPLNLIGYNISRPTYKKYVNQLLSWKLAYSTKHKGIRLIGLTTIISRYELDEKYKVKFIYLPNDQNLRHNIEKVVIARNLKAQAAKYASESRATKCKVQRPVMKKVSGSWKEYLCDPDGDTNLSRITLAHKLGFSHYITAWRRMKKWKAEGFARSIQRYIRLDIIPKEMLEDRRYIKTVNGYLKRLSNEIEIRLTKLGEKIVVLRNMSAEESVVRGYCNDCFD